MWLKNKTREKKIAKELDRGREQETLRKLCFFLYFLIEKSWFKMVN